LLANTQKANTNMPTVDLDFGNVGKVPEGWFRLVCDKAVYKPNKAKNGFIANMQMHLVDMPDEFEEYENMKIFDNPSFKLAARWKLQEVLGAFTGEDWEQDGMKLEVECEEDCGEPACEHQKVIPLLQEATAVGLLYADEYEGRVNARVKRYIPDDGTVQFGPDMTE
jgi:hypothetical protein